MIGQYRRMWISLPVRSVARIQLPAVAKYLEGFSLAHHILPTRPEPGRKKMAQSPFIGTTWAVDIKEEGRSPTTTDNGWNKKLVAYVYDLFEDSCSRFLYRVSLAESQSRSLHMLSHNGGERQPFLTQWPWWTNRVIQASRVSWVPSFRRDTAKTRCQISDMG